MGGFPFYLMPFNIPAIRIHGISSFVFTILFLGLAASLYAQPANTSSSLKKCWDYPTTELNQRGIASDAAGVYLSERGGRVEALSIDNGKRLWFSDLGGELISNIAVNGEAIYVATRSAGGDHPKPLLRSLSKTTGITNWATPVPETGQLFLGLSKSGLIAVSESGMISAVFPSNGSIRWTADLNAKIRVDPDFSPEMIIAATESREIAAVSAADGNISFRKKVSYRPTAVVSTGDGKAAWGDERGNLYLFSTARQKNIWRIKQGAAVSDLSDLGETLLATSNDNFAYSIAIDNGSVRWKKRQPDRIFRPALLLSKLIVLLSRTGSSLVVLEKDRGKAVDNISLNSGEVFVQPPAVAGSRVLFSAQNMISAYSADGCSGK